MKSRWMVFGLAACLWAGTLSAWAQQSQIMPERVIEDSALAFHQTGNWLFVGGTDAVRMYDISDRANPVMTGSFEVPAPVTDMASIGVRLLVGLEARDAVNLLVADFANIAAPQVLHERQTAVSDFVEFVYARGEYFYVGVGVEVLVLQLDNNGDIVQLGNYVANDLVTGMQVVGNTGYITTWFDIAVVDLSDPVNLSTLNNIENTTFNINEGLDIEGNILGVAEDLGGISLYDISDPANPRFLTNAPPTFDNPMLEIDLREGFAYTAAAFDPSSSVFELPHQGGLRVYDFDDLSNVRVILTNDQENVAPDSAFDVLALDGYVYVAGDGFWQIFRHGPLGERPTPTPVIPTATPTNTPTLTPTNTPPIIATPTSPGAEATATPTPSPSPTPPAPQPTNTPVAAQPTSTPAPPDAIAPARVYEFDQDAFAQSGWVELPGGFDGLTPGRLQMNPTLFNNIPSTQDDRGVGVTVFPNEVAFIHAAEPIDTGGNAVLVRMRLRSILQLDAGTQASFALGFLKGSFADPATIDGSLGMNFPTTVAAYQPEEGMMTLVFKPDQGNLVTPFIQLAHTAGDTAVTVLIDRIEFYVLRPGVAYPGELFQ